VAGRRILVGNGSNELIQATLSVILSEGDVVVAPAPTFSLYRLLTRRVRRPLCADRSEPTSRSTWTG
jgi:histidinol-phosphate/aromatic aminotransferase/cobyric acid decarboxylase-like protein